MTNRITQSELSRSLLRGISDNRSQVDKFSKEISTGFKVTEPGDTNVPALISKYEQALQHIQGYSTTVDSTKALFDFQNNVLSQTNDLLVRAKEIAVQTANETNDQSARLAAAGEILQIRDQIVQFANSNYQGRYIYGGGDDNIPPYVQQSYTNPASGGARSRWTYGATAGSGLLKQINIADSFVVTTDRPANTLFDGSIQALERLGRALQGYTSTLTAGSTDGGGVAYTFPAQIAAQTDDIKSSIDLLDTARKSTVLPELVTVAAGQTRLDTAQTILDLAKNDATTLLGKIRDADEAESASNLVQAQHALEASYTLSAKILNLSILNYI